MCLIKDICVTFLNNVSEENLITHQSNTEMCFVPKYTYRLKENLTSASRVPTRELLIVQGKSRITIKEILWHNSCDILLKASSIALNKLHHCLKKIISVGAQKPYAYFR